MSCNVTRVMIGPIPEEVSKLEELEQLFLADNDLEGVRQGQGLLTLILMLVLSNKSTF